MSLKKDLIETLPTFTGVYLLQDGTGKSIYIGKAKNLRTRILSYFNNNDGEGRLQVPFLMKEVYDVDYLITRNEREALILENSLIKKKKPKYNIRLKDDKNYTSLRLDPGEKFPKLTYTRRVKKDSAIYYGPFASAEAMRTSKRLIHKIFPLRDCSDEKFNRHSERPCLNYYMKMCSGPCAGMIGEEKYAEIVDQTKLFLRGKKQEIVDLLENNMDKASDEMRYEDAAHYRDQINCLEKQLYKNMLVTPNTNDKDIIGFYKDDKQLEFIVLFTRGGVIIDKVDFTTKNTKRSNSEVLGEFLGQFYSGDRFIPNEVIISEELEDSKDISYWLSEKKGKKVKLTIPKRGEKRQLLDLAMKNAEEIFKRKSADREKELHLLRGLQKNLNLSKLPVGIECFDISNIQGKSAVASLVRFENGKPAKSKYKKYQIKTVFGSNDYAMMYEVLVRRFKRAEQEGWQLPELIIVDGGKGQLNIAREVIDELGYSDTVELASLAKGKKEGESDKVYICGRKNPVVLASNSPELYLLMRIRDEAHRFAITYHKKIRRKKTLKSELDSIHGIGPKRKKSLLSHFGTISNIKQASLEEISSLPGMNLNIAKRLQENLT